MAQEPCQNLTENLIEFPLVHFLRRFFSAFIDANQVIAQERRHRHGDDPRQEKRDADDRKQRLAKLRRHAFGKGDGDEAGTGNQRTGQHRLRRGFAGVAGRFHAVPALLQLHAHHFDGDNRIVHQKPKRDNQRAEGNLVQVDAQHIHEAKRPRQHQRNAERNHHTRPEAEAHEAGDQHDDDRLAKGADKFVDGVLDHGGLVGHAMNFQPHGHFRLHLVDELRQVRAQFQDVAAGFHGNRDAHCRLAVEKHLCLRRVHGAAFHLRDVPEAEHAPARRDRRLTDSLHVVELARHPHIKIVRFRLHHARGRFVVLCFQRGGENLRGNAQLRQLRVLHFNVNLFRLHAEQRDILHAFHHGGAAAQLLRLLPHFLIGVAVAGDRVNRAVDVVETVVVIRPIDAGGQILLYVLAEIPQIAPGRANRFLRHVIPQSDINDRLPGARIAFDEVHAGNVAELAFQLVRNLLLHLLRRRAGPRRRHDHHADGKIRVLHAAQPIIRKNSRNKGDNDKIPDEVAILQRDFRNPVHGF